MSPDPAVRDLVVRLAASVGEAVYEDTTGLSHPPAPRMSWIDLQHEVVALATGASPDDRRLLSVALLDAIVHQPSFGPSNRLTPEAFAVVLDAAPGELADALDPMAPGHLYGGRRYLLQRLVWTIPGPAGAEWLSTLAQADAIAANFLYQDMRVGAVARWADEDWPARLDALAGLPAEPRPSILTVLFMVDAPAAAGPALIRLVMAHGRYTVEVGIAGFGAVAVYDQSVIYESEHADLPGASPPFWRTLDAGSTGSLVFCSVGPQHQTCRTWVGTAASGRAAAVVTDLGLLDLDLAANPTLPWE